MKTYLYLFFTVGVLMVAPWAGRSLEAEALTGELAPDFSLENVAGESISLVNFRGKYVVLEWTNPKCSYVKRYYESGKIQEQQEAYTGQGVVWLSICSNAPKTVGHWKPEKLQKYLSKVESQASHYLIDSMGSAGRAYGAEVTPHVFVIDPAGGIVYQGAFDDDRKGESKHSKNYLKIVLDAALAGKEPSIQSSKAFGTEIPYEGFVPERTIRRKTK